MIGKPLAVVFPWMNNWVADVENKTITHRPDLAGHFGIAVEIAAIYTLAGERQKLGYSSL